MRKASKDRGEHGFEACKVSAGAHTVGTMAVPFYIARERTSQPPSSTARRVWQSARAMPSPQLEARALDGPQPACRTRRSTRAPDATAGERRCRGFARTRATHHAQAEGEHIRDARVKRCPPRATRSSGQVQAQLKSKQMVRSSTRNEKWVVGFRSTRWFYAKRSPFSCTVAESCVRASGARTFVAGT